MKSKYKHAEVIKAFVDGVECELWYTEEKKWIAVKYLGDFDLYYDVRIKPEPQQEQQQVKEWMAWYLQPSVNVFEKYGDALEFTPKEKIMSATLKKAKEK